MGGFLPATAAGYRTHQWILECQNSNPLLDRLASAIQRGEIEHVRSSLDNGADVNAMWHGAHGQICFSLLLRSVWYGQEEIFRLLLKRGADPLSLPRESLQVPVRDGRVEMVRTLLSLGLKPDDNDDIVLAGLQSKNVAMLELLLSSGVSINGPNVPLYYFTNDITRFLVPRYLNPNERIYVGVESCAFEKLFDLFSPRRTAARERLGPCGFTSWQLATTRWWSS